MAGIVLFILAITILVFSLWEFVKSPHSHRDISKSGNNTAGESNRKTDERAYGDGWLFLFQSERERRRDYYRNEYLKSDAWKRKRYVVLRRDNWRCVYCGGRATQVHHKKYARRNIGKEPIEWLVSVCKYCHDKQHS
jgi:hypothetical protein